MSSVQEEGKLIHKILEIYGKNFNEDKKWLNELSIKIVKRAEYVSDEAKEEIILLTKKFLYSEQFDELLFGKVRCEVDVLGKIDGKNQIFRIDLLVEGKDEILIVDYKSEKEIPDVVPVEYERQLANYKKVIQGIFPNKKIKCAILWVRFLIYFRLT